MGFLAGDPAPSPDAVIPLHGLASAELDRLAALLLGEWSDIEPDVANVTGERFADGGRGLLYDGLVDLMRERPRATLAQRLLAVPEILLSTISDVLRWSDRPGFEPSAAVFCAAGDALRHEQSAA